MASIERRLSKSGKVSYRVKVRLKGYPVQTGSFSRLSDAKKWATNTESAIREGRHFKTNEARRHTLQDLIERYRQDVLPTKRNAARQGQQLAWWGDQIGAYALADVTPALIAEVRDQLARTPVGVKATLRSAASVNRYLAALSHCFTIAVKEYGWVEDNPVRKVTKPRENRGRVRYLSDGERERLLEACRKSVNPHLHDAVLLALATGGREMEVLGLQWCDVDLRTGSVTFHETKNGERRTVPVRGTALDMLKRRQKVRRLDSSLLFPGRNPAKPVEFRRSWEAALKAASIENFRWHDLRHTAASYLAMAGCSPSEIAEILGHKTLAMVKRYAHLSPDHLSTVADRLASRVDGVRS